MKASRGLSGWAWWLGAAVLIASVALVARSLEISALRQTWAAARAEPAGMVLALMAYAGAFVVRAVVWRRLLPQLPFRQALAALHVSLAGNHVLPLRLGEGLRVTSVVQRAGLALPVAAASTLTLRAADVLAVGGLALVLSAEAGVRLVGGWLLPVLATTAVGGIAGALWWRGLQSAGRGGAGSGVPALSVIAGALLAWVLESGVVWQAARWAGLELSATDAVLVTAVTIAAQVLALTPGGIGTYEAAATAAFVALGAASGPALAAAVTAHAVKTAYALIAGGVAMVWPTPGMLGRFRLAAPGRVSPAGLPPAARATRAAGGLAPVVLALPAHNEQDSVGDVVRRVPATVAGRPVRCLVIDDGSDDDTVCAAASAGAEVVSLGRNQGLGAAVRRGLAEGVGVGAAVVAFCDADGEYAPEELERLATPILDGQADYVVGSRFRGDIRRMLVRRRLGNHLLTATLRVVARTPLSDGQSGYRALSAAAARDAEIIHDFNYAQVLTLDLLGKGYRYAEVPISYGFRTAGRSFVRLGRYLRVVIPGVYRELNRDRAERVRAVAGG